MTAIILAGGKSSRMGYDKIWLEIEGISLIKRQVKALKELFEKIIIVTNNPLKSKQLYNLLALTDKDIKIIEDLIPGCGPLGGIYAGLMGSASFHNFVVACDLPFISPALIKYMVGLKDGFDVVVPKLKKGYETLLAIYSKDCLPVIKEIIAGGNLKVINLFPKIRLKEITEKEIREFGNPDILFWNINTPQDLNRILHPCSSMAMAGR